MWASKGGYNIPGFVKTYHHGPVIGHVHWLCFVMFIFVVILAPVPSHLTMLDAVIF
jgi:hypothetical protein